MIKSHIYIINKASQIAHDLPKAIRRDRNMQKSIEFKNKSFFTSTSSIEQFTLSECIKLTDKAILSETPL